MRKKNLFGVLMLLSGLVVGALSPTSAGAAQNHLDCRASALRLGLPLGQVVEPVVANPPSNPCATDFQAVVSFSNPLGIGTGALLAKTNAGNAPLSAKTKIAGLNLVSLLGLVDLKAGVIHAKAKIVAHDNGKCRLEAKSSLAGLTVLGQHYAVLNTPLDLDVKALGLVVAKLHLNATLGGKNPTMGDPDPKRITQRAVWLEVTDPLLKETLVDLIVGEASADAIGTKACK